ncbi:MAG: AgmX/PglI C-terminal domain-containing protein [Deltaproteobacteria bacterium]|nr:AgmX/PglI C-terminal domain-containing protein [Deltaproteobacteria bacterium]
MRSLAPALVLVLLACGGEPLSEPDPPSSIVARALEQPTDDGSSSDLVDAMPIEAPASLPALDVAGVPSGLSLEVLDVKVTVLGRLARTEVTQVFRNALPHVVEGTYRMTLPDAAVISRLAMDVEGVMTEGELVEKERARQIYDSIVHARKDPALLEWQGGNRFSMQVFPIPASGTKTIILEYEELLPVRGRRAQYAFGLPALGADAGARIGRFAFKLSAGDIGAPTVERAETQYLARVDERGVSFDDVAFVPRGPLRVSFPRPEPGSATLIASKTSDGGEVDGVFYVDVVPQLPGATRSPPRDLVLALDTSRGIGDRELARAIEAARRLAERPRDGRVVVVTGDLETTTCTNGPAWCLADLHAGGATDLEALLGAAARAAAGLDDPAIVLFSDGVASVGELDGDLLRERFLDQLDAEHSSVFTVAVGHAPDVDFLAKLANGGRGHPLRLSPASSVDGNVEELAHLLRVPLLLDVSAEVIEGEVEMAARPSVNLRPGEPLAIFARGPSAPFAIAVRGRWNDEDFEVRVDVEPRAPVPDRLVEHFWARAAIEALEREGASREQMVALSLRHGVMSRATSFLVLEGEAAYRRFGVERRREAERVDGSARNLAKGTEALQDLLGRAADKRDETPLHASSAPTTPSDLIGLDWLQPSTSTMELAASGAITGGVGGGGGGQGLALSGSGKIGTRGRGAGEAGDGSGDGDLGGRGKSEISMTQGVPVIMGSLDKELIRRVVRRHLSQLRYCYEKELTRTPGIKGKVVMKWVINGEGKVTQAQTADTTMRNPNVEGCIATKIKTWTFPRPGGGGIVIINYPFVFRADGTGGNAGPDSWAPPSSPTTVREPPPPPPPPPTPPPPPAPPRTLDQIVAARRNDVLDLDLILEEARLREALGDVRGARRTLSEIVELTPHDANRRSFYATVLLQRGLLSDTCEEYGHVAALQPARRELFKMMMGLRRREHSDAVALRGCIVDGVSRLPVQRSLSLVLTWEDPGADVDLHVIGPTGEHVSFRQREGKDGGLLYYDVTDGYGPEIYTLGQGHRGRYQLGVVHYRGPERGVRGTLTVIEDAGTPAERRRHLPFRLGAPDTTEVRTLAEVRL